MSQLVWDGRPLLRADGMVLEADRCLLSDVAAVLHRQLDSHLLAS